MGLTSCKQGTEVDPENPTPEKPVTPTAKGTELSGFKTVAELNKLLAETKDITDNIKAGGSVTITLDCSNLKAAAGDILVIPSKDDATINLVFANALKENKGLVISDAALDVVNIEFPSEDMGDFVFDMDYSKLTLSSEGVTTFGLVGLFTNITDNNDYATTIEDGIFIGAFKNWDDTQLYGKAVIEDGAEVEALVIDDDFFNFSQTYSPEVEIAGEKGGVNVSNLMTDLQKNKVYKVNSLYILDDATVNAWSSDEENTLETITIAEGKTLTIDGAWIDEVVGEGDTGAKVDYLGIFNSDAETSFKNVTIDGGGYSDGGTIVKATFESCTLVDFRNIVLGQASAKKLVFDQDNFTYTNVYYVVDADASDASFKYAFDSCEFTSDTTIEPYAEGKNVLDKNGDPIKETLYGYWWDNPDDDPDLGWQRVMGVEKLSDIPASVRKEETGWYWSYNFEPKVIPFEDLTMIVSLTKCKIDGKDVTTKNVGSAVNLYAGLWDADGNQVAYTKVEIDGKLYKLITNTSEGAILVEE